MRRTLLALAGGVMIASCGGELMEPEISSPAIDSIAPEWGAAGSEITIHGSELATDSPSVTFNGTAAESVTPVSASRLRAVVPNAWTVTTLLDVRVANPDGGVATASDAFEFVIPPVIDSVAPGTGTFGTEVRIDGSSFASDSVQVYFGDLAAAKVVQEGGSVFATVPAGLVAGIAHDIILVNRDMAADTLSAAFELAAPEAFRINGVSKPTGLVGMTIILDGAAFGDSLALSQGKIYFMGDTEPVEAPIADTANDWTNDFVVASVPNGTADTSVVWVETATGASDSIEFRLIQSGAFSPSNIAWQTTTSLPQGLQGLGAEFVPVEEGATPANYVFAIGGADSMAVATDVVYRAVVQQTGALEAWQAVMSLPDERAYHATTAATAFTAALDTATTAAYLYAIGGQDSTGSARGTTYYVHVALDGTVGAWQSGPDLPQPIEGAGAVLFRGYLYLVGGQDTAGAALATSYRARVNSDGSLEPWESLPALPRASAFGNVASFGPYIYSIGGDSVGVAAVGASSVGTEAGSVYLARLNLRTGGFREEGWVLTEPLKNRSKHSSVVGGGSLFSTSGVYSGQPGSLENQYAPFQTGGNGLVEPWNGATGADIIDDALSYSIYNQAAVYFIDQSGNGHVLVLGGARRDMEGVPSDGVVYY